jgi:predicted TPR repeat methyltransferase
MIVPEFLSSSGNLQVDRRYDYACGLAEDGDLPAAIELLEQTLALSPHWAVLPFTLGKFYKAVGDSARAIAYFEQSRALDTCDHQGAALELERLGLAVIESHMPPAFVETLFDQYADQRPQYKPCFVA